MSARRSGRSPLAIAALLLAGGAAALFARELWLAQKPPQGPVAVPWDRARCARCRMLVSDPAFAAQLQTAHGEVRFFDDPGDALLWVHERQPEVHALYFHHLERDAWIPREEVAFVRVEPTPMGYGLGAVERGERADALAPEAALETALAREAERREPTP